MKYKIAAVCALTVVPMWAATSFAPSNLVSVTLTVPVVSSGDFRSAGVTYDHTFDLIIAGSSGSGVLDIRGVVRGWDATAYGSGEIVSGASWMDINDIGRLIGYGTGGPLLDTRI